MGGGDELVMGVEAGSVEFHDWIFLMGISFLDCVVEKNLCLCGGNRN